MSENLVSMGVPGTEGNFQIPKENCTHLHFKIEFKKKKSGYVVFLPERGSSGQYWACIPEQYQLLRAE